MTQQRVFLASFLFRCSHRLMLRVSRVPRVRYASSAFALLLAAVAASALTPRAHAQVTGTLTVLRSFNGVNGDNPRSSLVLGNDGNLYGTTSSGGTGTSTEGTVFSFNPSSATINILHSFSGTDGQNPAGPIVQASDGNFYGTTVYGGSGNGYGTIYSVSPGGVFTSLKSFEDTDGEMPSAGLVQASDGYLYGTTSAGGPSDDGTIFRIGLDGTFSMLYAFDFHNNGSGGSQPMAALIQGSDGLLYGTTFKGGDNDDGTVFSYAPGGALTILHSFAGMDGANPQAALIEGSPGVFYGTTFTSAENSGTAFTITSAGVLTTLHTFTDESDGGSPESPLILGSDGNFYGTTSSGGAPSYGGVVYQLTPAGALNPLAEFGPVNATGPTSGLVQTSDGSFYGTTTGGGVSSDGTIYQLTVSPHAPFFNGQTGLGNGVEYLQFSDGTPFGYYSFLADTHYIYHFDLGYEYIFNAQDGKDGVYFYDFASKHFFYTSPTFPFPYLFDFDLYSILYYYPDPNNPGHYNTNGVRYFYDFNDNSIITE